jgi:hypothetical protein
MRKILAMEDNDDLEDTPALFIREMMYAGLYTQTIQVRGIVGSIILAWSVWWKKRIFLWTVFKIQRI